MSTTETMELNLPDVPDLSGVAFGDDSPAEWQDGWYEGTILEQRSFTDKNGNEQVFASEDAPARSGNGRNIWLQTTITRKSDNRTINSRILVNYQPEDLTAETVQAVAERAKAGQQMGDLFRPFMVLKRFQALQRIAGVRQLQRNGSGGLNLTPLYGKRGFFRLGPDARDDRYKEVKDFAAEAPKRVKVL